jgi:hypothetical protein
MNEPIATKTHWQNPKYEPIATELVWLENTPHIHAPVQKNLYLYNGSVIEMTNHHHVYHTLDKDYIELYISDN